MKSQAKAAASAAKWAFGLSFGYTIGPIAFRLVDGAELSGNFLAQKVVTGVALLPVLFISLWIWKSIRGKELAAAGSDQAEQLVKSSALHEKAKSSLFSDSAPPNLTGKATANKNILPVLAVVILIVCGGGYWVAQSRATTPEEAVLTNVNKPWKPLSKEQLAGTYAEPMVIPSKETHSVGQLNHQEPVGEPKAQTNNGGTEKNKKAFRLLTDQELFGKSLSNPELDKQTDQNNFARCQADAGRGDIKAQVELARIYLRGYAVPENRQLGVHWFWMAATQGSIEGQTWIAALYDGGLYVEEDLNKKLAWYLLAAEQGDAEAQTVAVWHYRTGKGVPQDYQEAAKWALRAAHQGASGAQRAMGLFYEHGEGVKQDLVQAHKWLNLAVAGGEQRAVIEREKLEKTMTSDQVAEAQRLATAWRTVK